MAVREIIALVGPEGPTIPTILGLVYDQLLRLCSQPGDPFRFVTSPKTQMVLGSCHNALLSGVVPSIKAEKLDLTLSRKRKTSLAEIVNGPQAADMEIFVLGIGGRTLEIYEKNIRTVLLVLPLSGDEKVEPLKGLLSDLPRGSWLGVAFVGVPTDRSPALPPEIKGRVDEIFRIRIKGERVRDGSVRARIGPELGNELYYDEDVVRRLLERLAWRKSS